MNYNNTGKRNPFLYINTTDLKVILNTPSIIYTKNECLKNLSISLKFKNDGTKYILKYSDINNCNNDFDNIVKKIF